MNTKIQADVPTKKFKTRANGNATRIKILDAAELLFGKKGYDNVSLKHITDEAQVTLALAGYHFKTKDKLFGEVIARRADFLSNIRLERLEAVLADKNHTVEKVIDAFMSPIFEQMKNENIGWSSYVKILSRIGEDDRWLELFVLHFDKTAQIFINEIHVLLPNIGRKKLFRGFSFVLFAMLQTAAGNQRVNTLSQDVTKAQDLDEAYEALLPFCVCGLLSLDS